MSKAEPSGGSATMAHAEPAENQIVVYQPNETVRLDVRLENETVWLNQARLAELFCVDRTVVNRHIHNIYKTGELDESATCAKIAQVQVEGDRSIMRTIPFYNLDMIIAVGYRVNSLQATRFRQWATKILREYLLRGYAVNTRLNQLEDKMDRRLAKHDSDIAELKGKVDFFVQTQTPPLQGVFYNAREAIADPDRQLGEHGGVRSLREEAQGRETDHFHVGTFQERCAETPDLPCRHRDLQRAVPETRRALQRNLPRPLSHHR